MTIAFTVPTLFLLVLFMRGPFKAVGLGERAWDQELILGLVFQKLFMGPERIHFLPLDPCLLWSGLRILRWGAYPGSSGAFSAVTKLLIRGRLESHSEGRDAVKGAEVGRCCAAAFEGGGRDHEPRIAGASRSWERANKNKKKQQKIVLEPSERSAPC